MTTKMQSNALRIGLGVLALLGLILTVRGCVNSVTDPVELSCSKYSEEVLHQLVEDEEVHLVIPVTGCETAIVLVPKDRDFEIKPDKCLGMIWEYEDKTQSAGFYFCPGERTRPNKRIRGVRFFNDGKRTNDQEVSVTIAPS